ncbi:unnamed protein product [Polarella glacialis]|uniref:K Homology domain-containing protein n=1 Tax=Polarella glacialis TaxID=89957 RepID=A0A813LF41_POLGL|nr:unnamed protein product [Polarella glacialis]CAE8725768.1 unnamed protein product [Polarella glacialis]
MLLLLLSSLLLLLSFCLLLFFVAVVVAVRGMAPNASEFTLPANLVGRLIGRGGARIQEPQTKTTATSTTTKATTTTTTTTTTAEAHRLLSQRAAARDFGSESRSRNSWTRGAHLHLHSLCGFLEDTCRGPGASGEMRASGSLAECRGPQPHGRSGADR